MDDWDPDVYLQFEAERTRPAKDLSDNINLKNPQNIIDIGCGPGNSTGILANKWPGSKITGLEPSLTMIEKAKKDFPDLEWIHDKAENLNINNKYSLVFANSSLHWIENHRELIPKLWKIVDSEGAFAAQIVNFRGMPVFDAINLVAVSSKWNRNFSDDVWDSMELHDLGFYYEILHKLTKKILLWETLYYQILSDCQEIIDFLLPTGLKPFMSDLKDERDKKDFIEEIKIECNKLYKMQSDGKILFPFKRMFMIAYKD